MKINALFVFAIAFVACQESIDRGIVVRKEYQPEKIRTRIETKDKVTTHTTTKTSEKYYLIIKGLDSKNQEVYQYNQVPKDTYLLYNVNDSFRIAHHY